MDDPDSRPPAKALQKKRVSIVPPAVSPDPGLNDFGPSPRAELHGDGQEIQRAPTRNHDRGLDSRGGAWEEEEEDGAFTKPRPPQLDLRRGVDITRVQNWNKSIELMLITTLKSLFKLYYMF